MILDKDTMLAKSEKIENEAQLASSSVRRRHTSIVNNEGKRTSKKPALPHNRRNVSRVQLPSASRKRTTRDMRRCYLGWRLEISLSNRRLSFMLGSSIASSNLPNCWECFLGVNR